jgi:anti-anti-sigma factor
MDQKHSDVEWTISMTTTYLPETEVVQACLDTTWPSPFTVQVSVTGEVDLATAHLLYGGLLSVLREYAPAVLVIDLAGVTFLDCAGLGALVGARNVAMKSGCQVRISHVRPIVRRMLEASGLLGVFALHDSIDAPQPSATSMIRLRMPVLGAIIGR